MIIRFHKGQYADAVVPTATQGATTNRAPGDILWELPADINPSKTINVTQNVQDTDPMTGVLLFNSDGTPKWKTTTTTDPVTKQTVTTIVTQQVPTTFTLMENPGIFTPADMAAVAISYQVVN